MTGILCAVLSVLFFFPAAGLCASAGGRFTTGPDGYTGLNFFAEWDWEERKGDTYYLRPSVDTYDSDLSDRRTTFALAGGLDRDDLGLSGEVFVQPEAGGYSKKGLYGNLNYYPPSDGGPAYSLGAFAGLAVHEDIYSSSESTGGFPFGPQTTTTRDEAFELMQYDLGVSASMSALGLRVSGRLSKTFYDQDVAAEDRRLPQGVGPAGFPDLSMSAGLGLPGKLLYPEVRYTRTSYLLDQPASRSLTLGLTLRAAGFRLYGGWENYDPGGTSDRLDYYSVGLSADF